MPSTVGMTHLPHRLGVLLLLSALVALCVPLRARALQCEANLMIVLDRSCTMRDPPEGTSGRTKWEIARDAIDEITGAHPTDIHYGLILFPEAREDGPDCRQMQDIPIPVGPDNRRPIRRLLERTPVGGPCVTNIDAAIDQVSRDPAFAESATVARRGYVLLVTDGRQSRDCGADEGDARTLLYIQDLYAAGYPTFVVGFGGRSDDVRLNEFAVAGGVPRLGAEQSFYYARDEATLREALGAISGIVAGAGEFGVQCEGVPCPDGRCFGAGHACVGGICVPAPTDPAPTDPPPGDGAGGSEDAGWTGDGGLPRDGGSASGSGLDRGASTVPSNSPGCVCGVPGTSPGSPRASLVLAALLGLAAIVRRRRRSRN